MGIRAVIIYFCFVFIGLINNYKNIYSRNNDVCLRVCMMVFMRIVSVKKGVMRWFLCALLLLKLFLVWKDIMCVFGGWGKMCEICMLFKL